MKSYVCMFNDKTLADDVVGTACEVGFDAMTRAVTWNRSNGTVAVTYGVMAEEVERNQVLDLVPNHQGGGTAIFSGAQRAPDPHWSRFDVTGEVDLIIR